jgi:hypothetical protein
MKSENGLLSFFTLHYSLFIIHYSFLRFILKLTVMKKMIFISIMLSFLTVLPAYCQRDTIDSPLTAADTLKTDFGLFTRDDVLNLSLRFDVVQYTRKKPKEEYLNATLTYHINEKDSINKEIRLKSRGEMRNGYCDFPPIRMNFKNAGFKKTDLSKIGKIKMVTHCQYGNEENLFKEYLIYKLYNALTDTSFRVRLVKIDYINNNPKRKRKPVETYSFLIEPVEMMAARIKAVPVESENLSQKNILPSLMNRIAIFNYMVGNTDWSVPNQHNVKVLSGNNPLYPSLGVLVPYDFDYSGLVNAEYAIPYEGLGIKSVRERKYVGICRDKETYIKALKEFVDKKDDFHRVINQFPLLAERVKKQMIDYLDEFYSGIDKNYSVVDDILNGCNKF